MGVPLMLAPVSSHPVVSDRDPLLVRHLERCAGVRVGEVWLLAIAWRGPAERADLVRAAIGVAVESGRAREVRVDAVEAARALRGSDGGLAAATRLAHTGVAFRAEAAAQEAALAILLRDHLSPEVRDALAAPWAVVFGDPLAPDDEGSRVA